MSRLFTPMFSPAAQAAAGGPPIFNYTAQTSNYTAVAGDQVNCTSGTFAVTLPTAVSVAGQCIGIKNSGAGVITLNTTSAQTIDGAASAALTLPLQYEEVIVVSNGANWIVAVHKCDTPWVTYTPTMTGFGTPSAVAGEWRRVGDSIMVRGTFTSGTATAVEGRISIPYTSDTAKIPTIRPAGDIVNNFNGSYSNYLLMEPTVAYLTMGKQSLTTAGMAKLNGDAYLGSGNQIYWNSFPIPIVTWWS